MKRRKLSNILLGLAAFLILSGGMLTLSGMAMGGRTSLYSNTNMETAPQVEHYTDTEAFQKIEVDVSLGEVYLEYADSYGVKLVWDDERMELYSEIEDGKLRVWSKNESISMMGFGSYGAAAYIYFPYGTQFEDVNVKNALGDLEMDGFTAKKLTVESNMGAVDLNDVTAGSAELVLSMGDLNAYGVTVGGAATVTNSMGDVDLSGSFNDLDVDCDMGEITIHSDRPKSDYSYNVETSMGEIFLDGDTQNGDSAKGGSGSRKLNVSNSMGDVHITFE